MRRQEYLFKGGASGIFVLTIEMCGDDLDKNIALADFYGQSWGEGAKEKTKEFEEGGSQTKSSFEKVAGVLCYTIGNSCQSDGDKKLLRYKCAWVLHQCTKCEALQKSQARDLFLQKIGLAYDRGVMYALNFMMNWWQREEMKLIIKEKTSEREMVLIEAKKESENMKSAL
uniref:F-box protein n=1 Tax=Meloidogyne hapla TaxID=6305 RepID=A0A1I8C260_MELHA